MVDGGADPYVGTLELLKKLRWPFPDKLITAYVPMVKYFTLLYLHHCCRDERWGNILLSMP